MSRIVILAKKGLKCKTFFANFLSLFKDFFAITATAVNGTYLIFIICKHHRIFNRISKA